MAYTAANVVQGLDKTATFSVGTDAAEVDLGYTRGGVRCRIERDYTFVEVDQEVTVIKAILNMKNAYLATEIAESLLSVLAEAWDNQAASGSTLTVDEDTAGERSVIFVGYPPGGSNANRTIDMPKAVSVGAGELGHVKNDVVTVPMEFRGIGNPSSDGLLLTVVDSA